MSIPIICFDFDGTLVNSERRIHPSDVEILTTERRAVFIPATARLLPSVRRIFEWNNLFINQPISLPLVLQNGALLYSPTEILQAQFPFPDEVQTALIEVMMSHPQATFWLYTATEVYELWPTPATREMAQRFNVDLQPLTSASLAQQFTKAVCLASTFQPVEVFAAKIAGLNLEQCYSLPTVLEINRIGVDKGYGLTTLLDILNLSDADIIAAGDGENDLPLFDLAQLSFAPNTSPTTVCARADHVITVAETGLFTPILRAVGLR